MVAGKGKGLSLLKNSALSLGLGLLVALSPLVAQAAGASTTALQQPKALVQAVGADNTTKRSISWQGEVGDKPGFLELKTTEKGRGTVLVPTLGTITYEDQTKSLYTVELNGLKPNSSYSYRIHQQGSISPAYRLHTGGAEGFTALLFGDAQSLDYGVWGKTVAKALETYPQPDLFIGVGDQVDNGERLTEWQGWYEGARPLITAVPMAPACGNHETYSNRTQPATGEQRAKKVFMRPQPFMDFYPTPANGPQDLQHQAYTFTQGPARFIVLNSQAGELRELYPNLLQQQAQWLEQVLQHTKEPWKFVVLHRSPLHNTGKLSSTGRAFAPLFTKYGVDAAFAGHTHIYERTVPLRVSTLNVSRVGKDGQEKPKIRYLVEQVPEGKHGMVVVTCGRSGTKYYEDKPASAKNEKQAAFYYNPVDMPNYLALQVQKDKATLTCYKQDGTMIDSLVLHK